MSFYRNIALSFYRNIACQNRLSDEGLKGTKSLATAIFVRPPLELPSPMDACDCRFQLKIDVERLRRYHSLINQFLQSCKIKFFQNLFF
jgi:hypothetical protein